MVNLQEKVVELEERIAALEAANAKKEEPAPKAPETTLAEEVK